MSDKIEGSNSNLGMLKAFVWIAVGIMLLIALWMGFIEAFSFGAPPGEAPSPQVIQKQQENVPYVGTIDKSLSHLPLLGDKAQEFLSHAGTDPSKDPESGPQAVWRDYITWWGILMLATA